MDNLREVFIYANNLNAWEADSLFTQLRDKHIEVIVYNKASGLEAREDIYNKTAFIITDNELGIETAKRLNIGCVLYCQPNGKSGYCRNASYVIEGFEEIDYDFILKRYQRSRGIPWTILATKRCIVREAAISDLDDIYKIYENVSVTAYMEGLYEDREQEIAFMQSYINNIYSFYEFGMWLIVEKATGTIIGRAGISLREGFDELELGYVLAKEFQGSGYAIEVCSAILEYGMKKLGCEAVNAFIHKENKASVSLALKLGFVWRSEVKIGVELLQRYYYQNS